MYGYFDESIVSVDGKKYITLGAVFSNTQCFKNEILNHLRKIKNISRDKKEIKYTNIRNKKVREEVVQKIKKVIKVSLFMSAEIKNNKEIHFHINRLLVEILTKFFSKNKTNNLKIIYDKSTYLLDIKNIKNTFPDVKEIKMQDSERSVGVQYADWIAGEGSEVLRSSLK